MKIALNPFTGKFEFTERGKAYWDTLYAPIANGVTNGNSHDHNGGDGAQIAHTNLSGVGTNTHTAIDSHLASASNPHSVTAAQTSAIPNGGWETRSEPWTRTGDFTFTIDGNVTATFRKGTKVRFKVEFPTFYYGIVISSSYTAPITTITLAANDDYSMPEAVITETAISYIENPKEWPDWFNYASKITYSASGSMIFTNVFTAYAKFRVSGQLCYVLVSAMGTTDKTASTTIMASAPIAAINHSYTLACATRDAASGGVPVGTAAISGNQISVSKANLSNYTLGTGRILQVAGAYIF